MVWGAHQVADEQPALLPHAEYACGQAKSVTAEALEALDKAMHSTHTGAHTHM